VIALALSVLACSEAPTSSTLTKTAWVVPAPVGGAFYIKINDPEKLGNLQYRYALDHEDHEQRRIVAWCPTKTETGSFTTRKAEFSSQESFAAFLRQRHGSLNFRIAA
jgi:hypothetical protein